MRVAPIVITLLASIGLAGHAGAAIIACGDVSAPQGGRATVEITLQVEGDEAVAGTQNDLEFDSAVFDIVKTDCVINPAIGPDSEYGKQLSNNVLSDPPRVRNLVLSLEDVTALPQSGALYTCAFAVAADAPVGDYTIRNTKAIASNPEGMQVPVTTGDCNVHVDPAPTPTPTPRCRTNEDCPQGEVCVDGECVAATPTNTPIGFCNDNEDCPEGQVCVDNRCVTPTPTATPIGFCTGNEDCPDGQVCVDNHCVTPTPTATPIGFCTGNEDCPLGQVCVNNHCVTPTPTPTVKKKGGGGGCSCEIDPRTNPWRGGDLLAILAPALLLALRRVQRQR